MKVIFVHPDHKMKSYFGLKNCVEYEICTYNTNGEIQSLVDHNNYNTQVWVQPEWCKGPPYVIEIPEDLFQL